MASVNQNSSKRASVTRRDFLRVTVGAITLLPSVTSALLLPPEKRAFAAVATEAPRSDLASNAEIYVVGTNELAVVVTDVSVNSPAPTLIPGALVRITSRYNGAVIEDTTDEHGAVHFVIDELAEADGKAQKPAVYAFNATIEVTVDGYRDFRTGLYRVEGGVAMSVPTQPREIGIPYPVGASLDEWDILYAAGDASEFVCCTGNDINHTFALELDNCGKNAKVTAGLYADGKKVAEANAVADSGGRAKVEFADTFLKAGSAAALPIGEEHSFTMRYTVGSTTYEVPIKLQVDAAPSDAQDQQVREDLALTPFNDDAWFIGITVPEGFPVIGGDRLKIWEPEWPVTVAFDPFGFARVKASTPDWGYVRDNGKRDPNGWKFHPRKTAKEQYDDMIAEATEAVDNTFDALALKGGKASQISFSRNLNFNVALDFIGALAWSIGDEDSRGRASLGLRIGLNYSLTETFWLGGFPIGIRFSVGVNAKAVGMAGVIAPHVWDIFNYRWDYNSIGFDLQVRVPFSLAVGVGVPGVASVSGRGSISFTFYLHCGPLPKGYENYPDAHVRFAAFCIVTVDLELLFFTQSHTIWESDWPDWYNNWNGLEPKQGAFRSAPSLGTSLGSAFSDPKIIDAQALAALAEFSTTGVAGMQAQEELLTLCVVDAADADGGTASVQLYLTEEEMLQAQGAGGGEDAEAEAEAAAELEPEAVVEPEAVAESEAEAVAVSAAAIEAAAEVEADPAAPVVVEAEPEAAVAMAAVPEPEVVSDEEQTAGESPDGEFEAQAAEEEPTLSALATEETISRWTTALPDAVPVGSHDYEVAPLYEQAGVHSLGRESGLVPSMDIRLASNILSYSRSKTYSIGGEDWLLRIGVVLVNGEPRTRVIAERLGSSEKRVLDFQSGIYRDAYLDYDFDLTTFTLDGQLAVAMIVVSGQRSAGDSTSLGVAAASTTFSYVCCRDWNGGGGFTGTSVSAERVDACGFGVIGIDPHTYYHHFSCPQITHIEDESDTGSVGRCVVTYLERAAETPEGLLSDVRGTVLVGVGMLFFDDRTQTPIITDMDLVRETVFDIIDGSFIEASLSERLSGWHILSLKNNIRTHYIFVNTHACAAVAPDGSSLPRILALAEFDGSAYGDALDRLVAVPGQGYFLTCLDGKLKRVDVVDGGGVPSLSMSDFGDADLNISDFGVTSSGDVLYWPATRDGHSTYSFSENDEGELDDDDDLNLIVGARIRSGKLSKAFTIGEVGHSMNRISSLSSAGNELSFVSSATIDGGAGQGEEWYTSVPWVRCATILGAAPTTYVLGKGDSLPFLVMIRNDGNCFISGVTLNVREVGGPSVATFKLVFSESNTLESEWNPRGEDGALENVEDDYALAPGMTSLYYAEEMVIPDTWEGTIDLEVVIVGVDPAAAGFLTSQAEDNSIEYLPNRVASASLNVRESQSAAAPADFFTRADVTVIENKPDKRDGGGSSDDKRSRRSGERLPQTGDVASAAAEGALLAAGGAALLTGYSVRRTQVEREQEQE